MFELGHHSISNFKIWIAASDHPDYFEVLLLEKKDDQLYYINLHKDARFHVEFKYPPKPTQLKKDASGELQPIPETPEEAIYRREYNIYAMRKYGNEFGHWLWCLHRSSAEKVLKVVGI